MKHVPAREKDKINRTWRIILSRCIDEKRVFVVLNGFAHPLKIQLNGQTYHLSVDKRKKMYMKRNNESVKGKKRDNPEHVQNL